MPLTSKLPAALANSSLVRLMSSAVARPVCCNSSAVFLMSSAAIVDLLCDCVSGPSSDKRCDRLIVPAAMAFPRPLFGNWVALLCGPFANFFFLGLAIASRAPRQGRRRLHLRCTSSRFPACRLCALRHAVAWRECVRHSLRSDGQGPPLHHERC